MWGFEKKWGRKMYGVWKNVVTLQRQKEIKSLHKESGADRKKDNKFKD